MLQPEEEQAGLLQSLPGVVDNQTDIKTILKEYLRAGGTWGGGGGNTAIEAHWPGSGW